MHGQKNIKLGKNLSFCTCHCVTEGNTDVKNKCLVRSNVRVLPVFFHDTGKDKGLSELRKLKA